MEVIANRVVDEALRTLLCLALVPENDVVVPPPFQRVACACEEERIGVNHLLASQRRLHLRLLLLLLLPRQLLLLLHSLQLLHQERRVVL